MSYAFLTYEEVELFLNGLVDELYGLKTNQISKIYISSRKHISDVEKGVIQLDEDTQRNNINSIFKLNSCVKYPDSFIVFNTNSVRFNIAIRSPSKRSWRV